MSSEEEMTELAEQLMDTSSVLSEAAVGMRRSLIEGGYPEQAATFMGVSFYNELLRRMMHDGS